MGWDKFFMEGLQNGVDIALKKKVMEQEAEKWKEEKSIKMLSANLVPDPQGAISMNGEKYSRLPLQTPDLSSLSLGSGGQLGLTGATVNPEGGISYTIGQTPEAKVTEQATIAQQKENETALGKAERLKTVGNTIEKQWLKTSPYKGAITKTGLVPALGAWDILKKGIGATDAQRQDQAYASFIAGIRAQLARGMGDVGNLSEYEQRAVIQLVPNLMDSYESGMLKLGQLAQLVEDIKTTRKGKQGVDMQTFAINGTTYNIPKDKVSDFKKAKGIK